MVQDRPVRVERRLSAILAADVSGYSRLMHQDEEATHAKLMALLANGVWPVIAEHGGRVVKNTGDGFLAEFPSAVEAVRAAMQFQTKVRERTTHDHESGRISFRVGVNIGDIIVEPHDIFGDGVNIAARLESVAAPVGICISSAVYDQVQGKIEDRFVDLGEQTFKNIARPVRVYAIINELKPATPSSCSASSPLSPPRLSIVVLPFANLSGDLEQDYFVDGVTGSLTTDLSRIGGSFVIGQHTAFTYKGKFVDIRQIGRELNVRYALEGSVQRCESRLRVNVQLIDAKTGNHLWADRFDKPIAGLLDMQDEIVSRIARTLDIQLIVAEARRAEKTLNPDAMDFYFQGRHFVSKGLTSECLMEARRSFELALAIDPNNVEALSWTASVEAALGLLFLTDRPQDHLTASEALVLKALRLAPDHPWAHFTLATLLINTTNRMDQGVAECHRALALDPNLADAHVLLGIAKFYSGCGGDTEIHVREALRLSPRDVFACHWMSTAGFAKLQIAEDAEAVAWFARGLEANRNFTDLHFGYAAALALLGKQEEARAAARTGLAVDPTFTIRRVRGVPARGNAKFVAGAKRFIKGLYIAGVPEA